MDLPIKEVILLQTVLEVFLLVLLVLVLVRTGRKGAKGEPASIPSELQTSISRFLSESERISRSFSENLEDKKRLSSDLILKLDERLAGYRRLLEETDLAVGRALAKLGELNEERARMAALRPPGEDKANPAAPEVRALVLKLAREGLSVEEIALRSRLHRGEVELIIDLESQFSI